MTFSPKICPAYRFPCKPRSRDYGVLGVIVALAVKEPDIVCYITTHLFSLMRTLVKYMKTVNHHSGNALAYAIRDDIIRGSLSGMVVPVSVRVKVCDR